MNTNEQAPECCPFCGAKGGGLYEGVARQYECGSWDWPKVPENGHPRESQSTKCAAAERERLTRERDEARAERDNSREAFGNMKQSYEEAVAANINALNQIGDLCMENANLLARVKRLEEAGDEVVEEDNIYDRRRIWRKATTEEAKEAKP